MGLSGSSMRYLAEHVLEVDGFLAQGRHAVQLDLWGREREAGAREAGEEEGER